MEGLKHVVCGTELVWRQLRAKREEDTDPQVSAPWCPHCKREVAKVDMRDAYDRPPQGALCALSVSGVYSTK